MYFEPHINTTTCHNKIKTSAIMQNASTFHDVSGILDYSIARNNNLRTVKPVSDLENNLRLHESEAEIAIFREDKSFLCFTYKQWCLCMLICSSIGFVIGAIYLINKSFK